MKLYGYWRSGATYRIRIVMALKGLAYDYVPVNLLKDEQKSARYRSENPQGLLPTLVLEGGMRLTQSLAIAEFLEETHPSPALLPSNRIERTHVRAICSAIACEAQPLQNLRVQKYLRENAGFDDAGVKAWIEHWVGGALAAVEAMVGSGGKYCVGDAPTLADAFLVPQIYAARRFGVDLSRFPRLNEVNACCVEHPAFVKAHPDNQPDAVKA
jgi:maleylacetoacetate isomerase